MVYNLVEYVNIQLPTLIIIADGFANDSPQESLTFIQQGGDEAHFYERGDWAIQVLSRSESVFMAKLNIEQVYNLLLNRIHLQLPEVTVNSIYYPSIMAYQISPVQKPAYIGADDKNLETYSYNMIVTTN